MIPPEPPLLDLSYFQHGHTAVAGWLQRDALLLTLGLHRVQRAAGQGGSVAEIGVHHGKFFIALALLASPEEAALAVDIFERQDLNPDASGHGDRAVLEAHLARWRVQRRSRILARDSLTLAPAEVLALGGQIRLFSVDGGHTRLHAANDLALAEACLAPGGVVLLDDFFDPDWPGVTEAALARLQAPDATLAPLAVAGGKLFLVRRQDHAGWAAALAARVLPWAARVRQVELAGWPCQVLGFTGLATLPAQIGTRAAQPVPRVEFSLAGLDPPPGLFGAGWSGPEDWGRWSLGAMARLLLPLPPGPPPRQLLLHARGLVPPLSLALQVGGVDLPALLLDQPQLASHAVALPPLPPGAATLEVVLRPSRWASPAELGLSTDARPLGVAVATLALEF